MLQRIFKSILNIKNIINVNGIFFLLKLICLKCASCLFFFLSRICFYMLKLEKNDKYFCVNLAKLTFYSITYR